jgi:hypothetical protein
LTGRLECTAIKPERIDITWQVPGCREQGVWLLHEGP